MIKHIVFWRFKEEAEGLNKEQIAVKTKEILEALVEKIPEIKELEVGRDFNGSPAAFDTSLYTAFESKEALKIYQEHPAHREVAGFIGKVTSDRAVVDYEV